MVDVGLAVGVSLAELDSEGVTETDDVGVTLLVGENDPDTLCEAVTDLELLRLPSGGQISSEYKRLSRTSFF
jgi:hypothetical protein